MTVAILAGGTLAEPWDFGPVTSPAKKDFGSQKWFCFLTLVLEKMRAALEGRFALSEAALP